VSQDNELELLVEALSRFGEEHRSARDPESEGFDRDAWNVLSDLGFTGLGIAEDSGGSGGTLVEAITACEVLARYGVQVPLGDHAVVAGWLCELAGWEVATSPVAVAIADQSSVQVVSGPGGLVLEGRVTQMAWAQCADRLIVVVKNEGNCDVCLVDAKACSISNGTNMAGEPRDTVSFKSASPDEVWHGDVSIADEAFLRGALVRTAESSGALYRVVELARDHVTQRTQFGKPLGSFQAVRHRLAEIAEETAVTRVAVRVAAERSVEEIAELPVICAKLQSARAATIVSAGAHQLLGAIGTTEEHELGRHTRRLWSWRDEYGREEQWARNLGRRLVEAGEEMLWPEITQG